MNISALNSFAELRLSNLPKIKLPEPPSNAFAPEEPVFLDLAEGFGHYPFAAAERELNKYILKRKLGWGASSTVWLVEHKTTHEYVAIKILSAHATLLIDGKLNPEIIVNELISSADPSHPGHQKCLSTITTFPINSIAGKHICLVLPLMNGSIIDLRPPAGNLFAMPVAKRIIKDVLLGLDYLHTRCGYVHTDLRMHNVLVKPSTTNREELTSYLNDTHQPRFPKAIEWVKDEPSVILSISHHLPQQLFKLDEKTFENMSVCISDYSCAMPIDTLGSEEIDFLIRDNLQPKIVRAPEVILGYKLSTAMDIWSVGCLAFQLVAGHFLLEQDLEQEEDEQFSFNRHIQYISEYLGPFTKEYLDKCPEIVRKEYFDDDGKVRRIRKPYDMDLETVIKELTELDGEEFTSTAAFMRRCLDIVPEKRASAQELLSDPWLKDVQ